MNASFKQVFSRSRSQKGWIGCNPGGRLSWMKANNQKQVTAKESEERKKNQEEIRCTSNKANAEANTAADAISEGRAELPELWSSKGRKPPENALLLVVPPGGVHGFFVEGRSYKGSNLGWEVYTQRQEQEQSNLEDNLYVCMYVCMYVCVCLFV